LFIGLQKFLIVGFLPRTSSRLASNSGGHPESKNYEDCNLIIMSFMHQTHIFYYAPHIILFQMS